MPTAHPMLFKPAPSYAGLFQGYAPSPVWRDSTTREVKFRPLPKRQAVKIMHDARRLERATRRFGRQDGAVTRNGLAILQAMLFDFVNYATGRLDPSYQAIARKACVSVSSVRRGLMALKAAGIVWWQRRADHQMVGGHFTLRQETNAYGVMPSSSWPGYVVHYPYGQPTSPAPSEWGAQPPLPSPIEAAQAAHAEGGGVAAFVAALESDPTDELAAILGRLGRRAFLS